MPAARGLRSTDGVNSALARLRPRRTDDAFVLLDDAARNVAQALDTLEQIVHGHPASGDLVPLVRDLDAAVRRKTLELARRLNERFVVPAEPDDLRRLADSMAAVAGGASHIAGRLTIFRLPARRASMRDDSRTCSSRRRPHCAAA